MLSTILTPFLAFENNVDSIYKVFSYTCHQKMSRSLCLFKNNKEALKIENCLEIEGQYIPSNEDRTTIQTIKDEQIGYKIPICARDIGLYGGMLLSALIYPKIRKLKEVRVYPPIFFVLALVPMGIDGTVQLISEFGFLPFVYESTNAIRIATGLIAGVVATFYALPIIMSYIHKEEKN
jgi:uncharacterized membrane protein